jgi:hypothetical protein
MTSLPWSSAASRAVMSDPEPLWASITITPRLIPEMSRLRAGKLAASGLAVSGSSEITAPPGRSSLAILSNRGWFSGG